MTGEKQYTITEDELSEWEAGGMCWSEEKDLQRSIRSRPYVDVLDELEKFCYGRKHELAVNFERCNNTQEAILINDRRTGILEVLDELTKLRCKQQVKE